MIDRIRSLLAVIEEGSVNRAAVRLRITQPALSRQMQTLEQEVGGKLLERETTGVTPTALGHALVRSMKPVMANYDAALAVLRRQARGERSELRAGYLVSAAESILTPALALLRKSHPGLKLVLHDMSPREQIDGLRAGDLDVALTGQEGGVAAREFQSIRLAALPVCAALADSDPLAGRRGGIFIRELRDKDFIGVDENQMPGRNRWLAALCRSAGFKPRFAAIVDGLSNVLSHVVSESAVTLLPDYLKKVPHPGICYVPVRDEGARWDLIVLLQKGRVPEVVRALVDALKTECERKETAGGVGRP